MVRYSVTSSNFTVNSTKVNVNASAYVGYSDYDPADEDYDGHAYRVEIIGWLTRTLNFEVGGTESGTISGLQNGGSYKVRIANEDYLESPLYLIGGGTISRYFCYNVNGRNSPTIQQCGVKRTG